MINQPKMYCPARSLRSGIAVAILGFALAASGCQPSVKIEAPDKPITINVNVRIQIEKDVDALIKSEDE